MQTERFIRVRRKSLDAVFEKQNIISVWRKIVEKQLRDIDLLDLFDHYDFNYNIEDRAQSIRTEILNGTFKASQPLIYRIEKKTGNLQAFNYSPTSRCIGSSGLNRINW